MFSSIQVTRFFNAKFSSAVAGVFLVSLATVFMGSLSAVAAPVSYTNGTYTQNFDSLASSPLGGTPTWTDGVTVPGWYAFVEGVNSTSYRISRGDFYSPRLLASLGSIGGGGTNPDSDRALGTQSTPSSTEQFGVAFTNASASLKISFTATYDGEQWRRVTNEGVDDLIVDYQIFDAGLGSLTAGGTWTTLSGLTFNAPNINTAGSTLIDGNLAINRVAGLTETVSDLEWNPGQELWLRFTDNGPTQHIMAADNFIFSTQAAPIPEPSCFLLLGLGVIGLMKSRRSRKDGLHQMAK